MKPPARRRLRAQLLLPAVGLLAGCSAGLDDLQAWIDGERQSVKARVKPIQPPRPFTPEAYEGVRVEEPFSPQKLSLAVRQEAARPNAAIAAELNRRKEPLEAYPLESMSMVGSLSRQGGSVALLRVDSLLYMVRPGDYLGQNYGRVTKVEESRVEIRELLQDAGGEWVTRTTALTLQDKGR